MTALPSPEEFAQLVAAFPDIPDLPQPVPAEHAGPMIGIQPGSIRIPRDTPDGWRLDTLVAWRASLPGRGHGAGRPPVDTESLVARLRERVPEDGERLTVLRVMELLDVGRRPARRAFTAFTGQEPVRGRVAGD
jgi:hypothetical protein